ncbi:MAG: hypothetical protein M3169_01555 [Candidatus Eremiobacteraeota bacterium]|nr:hypothetical protein [Candidatus Eremiobacteraeota bacterium]
MFSRSADVVRGKSLEVAAIRRGAQRIEQCAHLRRFHGGVCDQQHASLLAYGDEIQIEDARDAGHSDRSVGEALRDGAACIELAGDFPVVTYDPVRVDVGAAKTLVEQAACTRAGRPIRNARLRPRDVGRALQAERVSVRDEPAGVRPRDFEARELRHLPRSLRRNVAVHDSRMKAALAERLDRGMIRHREPQDAKMSGSRHGVTRQQPDRELAAGDEDVRDRRLGRLDREVLIVQSVGNRLASDRGNGDPARSRCGLAARGK